MSKLFAQVKWRSIFLVFLSWAIAAGVPGLAIGDSNRHSFRHHRDFHQSHSQNMNGRRSFAGNHHSGDLSPEAQDRLRKNFKEWKSLSPENRKELRHRMDHWRELSPEEKNLYQKRYHQFQQLPPDERGRVRKKLDRWDDLSPQEKDEIRRSFPRH